MVHETMTDRSATQSLHEPVDTHPIIFPSINRRTKTDYKDVKDTNEVSNAKNRLHACLF